MGTTTNQHSDNQNELGAPPKKVRGPTQKNELWNMSKNNIVVKFNKYGKPVGVEGNELTQFLGSVVRIAGNVGLNYKDWRKVDKEKKEDMYSIVKEKFVFHLAKTSAIKKWIFSSMGKKLNTCRNLVKSRNYDPSLSVEEIMARQTDNRVNPEQFQDLVNRWMEPEYQAVCEKKRISRSKMEEPHVTGTKRLLKIMGVQPTRGKLYQISRTRKDGSIVNDKAAQFVTSLQAIANDSTNTQGTQQDDWTNEDLSKVKGREKRGYVRCMGKMLSLNNNGASSSTSSQTVEQRLAQTEDLLYTIVNLLKDPTTNSNVSDVLRSMNIEISANFSPGQTNSTNGNQGNSNQGSSDQNIGTPTNLS